MLSSFCFHNHSFTDLYDECILRMVLSVNYLQYQIVRAVVREAIPGMSST